MNGTLRRDRGSAMLITLTMIVVMIAMIGLLLAAPNAQLAQVASSQAKERSLENADAGLRDAVDWLIANRSNLQTMLGVTSTTTGGTTTYTPTTVYVTEFPGSPASMAYSASNFDQVAGFPNFYGSIPSLATGQLASLGAAKTYFVPFGSQPTMSAGGTQGGEYAYAVYNAGNNYFRVMVEGHAQSSQAILNGSGVQAGSNIIATRIDAYIYYPFPSTSVPGAVTFLNPNNGSYVNTATGTNSGWTNPDATFYTTTGAAPTGPMITTTVKGGGADKVSNTPGGFIVGNDSYTPPVNTNGVMIQGGAGSLVYDNTSGTSTGTPSGVQTSNSASTFSGVQAVVNTIANLPAGTQGVYSYTYSAGTTISLPPAGSSGPVVVYLSVPANTTVVDNLFNFSGSATFQGVLIVDLGNNVTLTGDPTASSNAIMRFNGNPNQELGGLLINQRGTVNLPPNGIYLGDERGNASDKLQWNSFDYSQALANISIPIKIASYRVVQ